MYLEKLVQSEFQSRLAVKPSPEQIAAYLHAFAARYELAKKLKDADNNDLLGALLTGAQQPRKRRKGGPKPKAETEGGE